MRSFAAACLSGCLAALLLVVSSPAWGQVRSSSNFQIDRDVLSGFGGLSTSTNFSLEQTGGESGAGRATSSSFLLQAGFQQEEDVTLTLSTPANVVMAPELGGVTGGESNGSTSVIASTDGNAGYQLTIQASATPALRTATDTIADYTPAGGPADLLFTTAASDAHFGFSPFGADVSTRWLTNGSVCGSGGSASSTACWDGLSTSPTTIAQAAGANAPGGATTTLYFKVGIGATANVPPGTYVATTTITLLSL